MSQNPKPLLVLDLDQTLIYCHEKPYRESQIETSHGHLSIRDHHDDFLRQVAEHYDLIVWSTSGPEYINDILAISWPKDVELRAIMTSKECDMLVKEGYGVPFYKNMKRLRKIYPEYPLERIVGIDDTAEKYKNNYGNLIVVKEFKGHPDDELLKLGAYLVQLSELPNFREVEKRYWHSGQKPRAKALKSHKDINYDL